jgi:hypothetical protein
LGCSVDHLFLDFGIEPVDEYGGGVTVVQKLGSFFGAGLFEDRTPGLFADSDVCAA